MMIDTWGSHARPELAGVIHASQPQPGSWHVAAKYHLCLPDFRTKDCRELLMARIDQSQASADDFHNCIHSARGGLRGWPHFSYPVKSSLVYFSTSRFPNEDIADVQAFVLELCP